MKSHKKKAKIELLATSWQRAFISQIDLVVSKQIKPSLIDVDEKTTTNWRWQKNFVATSLSCEIFVLILRVKSVES